MFKKHTLTGFYAFNVQFYVTKKQGQPKENLFVLNMFGNLVSEKSKPQKSRQLLFYAQIFLGADHKKSMALQTETLKVGPNEFRGVSIHSRHIQFLQYCP